MEWTQKPTLYERLPLNPTPGEKNTTESKQALKERPNVDMSEDVAQPDQITNRGLPL